MSHAGRANGIVAGSIVAGVAGLVLLAVVNSDDTDHAAEAAPAPSSSRSPLSRYTPAPELAYTPSPPPVYDYSGTATPTAKYSDPGFAEMVLAQKRWDESSPRDQRLNCEDYRNRGAAWYRGVLRGAGESDGEVEASLAVVRRECAYH